jgi:hypothetical protein
VRGGRGRGVTGVLAQNARRCQQQPLLTLLAVNPAASPAPTLLCLHTTRHTTPHHQCDTLHTVATLSTLGVRLAVGSTTTWRPYSSTHRWVSVYVGSTMGCRGQYNDLATINIFFNTQVGECVCGGGALRVPRRGCAGVCTTHYTHTHLHIILLPTHTHTHSFTPGRCNSQPVQRADQGGVQCDRPPHLCGLLLPAGGHLIR